MRLRRSISIVLAASLASLACAQTRVSVEAPFELKNAMILIDVPVNGRSAVFLLDTGAVDTYVDTSELKLHLESAGSTMVSTPIGNKPQRVFLARISFGTQELHMHVVSLDLSQLRKECECKAAGILGMSALQTFSEFEVDLRNKLLTLRR